MTGETSTETMPLLSAVTYTKDNSKVIVDAVKSLRFAGEVILLDSGSSDDTIDLAQPYVDRVEHRAWTGFCDQLNHIQGIAKGRFILVVDADERVSPESAQEILKTINDALTTQTNAWGLPRSNRYMGKYLKHGELWPDVTLRLYRRGEGRYEGEPHARLIVANGTPTLKFPLIHLMQDSLQDQLHTIALYTESAAQEMYQRGERGGMIKALLNAPTRFMKAYILKFGFLDGWPGLVVALTSSFAVFMKYARLSELQKESNDSSGEKA
jgi:glycosyltransferase involved in cell wall biosynthesis